MCKRNFIIGASVILVAVLWYAFRPELLFINKTVSEEFLAVPPWLRLKKDRWL